MAFRLPTLLACRADPRENSMAEHRDFYHRHLPHWQPQGATFFVTYRLKDSLPNTVIETLRAERELAKRAIASLSLEKREEQDDLDERRSFGKWDDFLDRAETGPKWLSESLIAEITREALHYRDNREYHLYAFCIMSNHVHVVFEPLTSKSDWQSDLQQPNLPLQKIMQSLKRHTARKSNELLSREGAFWQDESYDRVIRDNNEFLRIIHYVLNNPIKAGLVAKWEDWPRSYCKPGIL